MSPFDYLVATSTSYAVGGISLLQLLLIVFNQISPSTIMDTFQMQRKMT